MSERGSIFLDFLLPNATTWFYFSALLAVALFVKFSRLLSMRNWDLITLFFVVPGFLLLHEAHTRSAAVAASRMGVVALGSVVPGAGLSTVPLMASAAEPSPLRPARDIWFGYLWLMCASLYFFVRCLIDLALVRRPALSPNLNFGGLAWLAGALLGLLAVVACRHTAQESEKVGKASAVLDQAQRRAEDLVTSQAVSDGLVVDARFWVERCLAMLCHLAVVVALVVIGCTHFQDATTGMAAATLYLVLPFTAYHVGQVQHVWPMALMVWAVVAYRRPVLAGLLLGLAAGSVYFPALIFPAWCSFYWRRGARRFATTFFLVVGISLGVSALMLWREGDLQRTLNDALTLADWQPWKVPTTEGFWLGLEGTGVHWSYRMPVFIVHLAFVLGTAFWPAPKNLAHLLAVSTAVLIGIQFWHADQGGVYVLWYLPYLLLLVFRPNLSDRVPPLQTARHSRLAAIIRWLAWRAVRLVRLPQPTAPVG